MSIAPKLTCLEYVRRVIRRERPEVPGTSHRPVLSTAKSCTTWSLPRPPSTSAPSEPVGETQARSEQACERTLFVVVEFLYKLTM